MKLLKSQDNKIVKFIHDDKTETVIKYDDGCGENSGDKYTVFISSSYGCQVGCKFCMLNSKGIKYSYRSADIVYTNTKEAIQKYTELNPDMQKRMIKLSWMGMGEPLYDMRKVAIVSSMLNNWILDYGHATYIEGVDIGTSFARFYLNEIKDNIEFISEIGRRSPRIFISLGSVIPITRNFLIPSYGSSRNGDNFLKNCKKLIEYMGPYNVIFHMFFLNKINDSDEEVNKLIDFMKNIKLYVCEQPQLRVLRFNECDNSIFRESKRYEEIKKRLSESIENIKFQISPGKEVMASCGQFVCEMEE